MVEEMYKEVENLRMFRDMLAKETQDERAK